MVIRISRRGILKVLICFPMRLCSNVPAQSVVQTALGGHQSVNDYIVPGGRFMSREILFTRHSVIFRVSQP